MLLLLLPFAKLPCKDPVSSYILKAVAGMSLHDASYLEYFAAIHTIADALAYNLCGVHQVIQDGIMHLRKQT